MSDAAIDFDHIDAKPAAPVPNAERPRRRGRRLSRPETRLPFMVAVLGLAVAGLIPAYDVLADAFRANLVFNGVIAGVFAGAVALCLWRVARLAAAAMWLHRAASAPTPPNAAGAPALVRPLARLLHLHGEARWPAQTANAALDAVAARFSDAREASRYAVGLLIFLGLLGTFWGLLLTLSAVGDAFADLNLSGSADVAAAALIDSLRQPLNGMATAFSSSLFGLGGSLIAGFLELQANRGQSRLLADFEDWAAERMRTPILGGEAEGGAPAPYLNVLIEALAERIESLEDVLERFDRRQSKAAESLVRAVKAVEERIAQPTPTRGAEPAADAAARLRAIEDVVARMADDMASARSDTVRDLRAEIRMVGKALTATASSGARPGNETA